MKPTETAHAILLRCACAWPLVFGLTALCGCGQRDIERAIVSGTVSYQGVPVEKGEIAFIPEGPQPTTIARITGGVYRVVAKGGVPVGSHKVEIKAFRNENVPPSIDLAVGGASKQFLPPRYNKETELTVTIESSASEITQDFHLK